MLTHIPRQSISLRDFNRVFNRGSILILALWALCFLAAFAVVLNYGVRQKATLVKRLDDRGKLRMIADAGLKRAMVDLSIRSEAASENETDSWTLAMSASRSSDVGDGVVQYALIDETRKININLADRATLERLFHIIAGLGEMEAQGLAASIIDWRDEDSMLSVPFGSAEDREYTGDENPYEAKDSALDVLDELLLVNGMTTVVYDKIKDYVTIYGEGKININTASKEVFLILGVDDYLADLICLHRLGEDGVIGTEDDNVFEDRAAIVPTLSRFYHLGDANIAALTQAASENFVTNAGYFTVKSEGKLRNTKLSFRAEGVLDGSGTLCHWYEP